MQDRSAVSRWLPAVFGLFFAAIVGIWAYDLGLSHGIAQQLPPPPAGVYPWAFYRPWGVWTVLSAGLPRVLVLRAPDLFLQGWSVASRVARVL